MVWLQAQKGVKHARLNYACACLVIEYDVSFEGVLRATLGQLSVMSIADLQRLVGTVDKPAAPSRAAVALTPAKSPSIWSNTPLALPTVSLLMAFSANPIVTAINMPLMLWNAISDRAAGLAGVAAREPPQCRFPRHARDHRFAAARQSAGRRASSPG